jgi:hypothetical protein
MTIRLGDLLVKAKVINEGQLRTALAEQQKWGGQLGDLLVRLGYLKEEMLLKALTKQMNVQSVNLDAVESLSPSVRAKLSYTVAKDLVVLPLALRDDGKSLVVAMSEPQNLRTLDTLRSLTGCRIIPQLAGRNAIARAFSRLYGEAEISELGESFKLMDAQGKTLVRKSPVAGSSVPAGHSQPLAAKSAASSPAATLTAVEEAQRQAVAVLKSMVELLVEKGVFTRDEYLAKLRR